MGLSTDYTDNLWVDDYQPNGLKELQSFMVRWSHPNGLTANDTPGAHDLMGHKCRHVSLMGLNTDWSHPNGLTANDTPGAHDLMGHKCRYVSLMGLSTDYMTTYGLTSINLKG